MDILFIYNLENKDYDEVTLKVEEGMKDIIKEKMINVKRKDKINTRTKADVYVILSDESEEIDVFYEKLKNKNKSIVLTRNLSSSHILNLINHTKNICYMKNDVRIIVRKIYDVYTENLQENV